MTIADVAFWGSILGLLVLIGLSYRNTRNVREACLRAVLLIVCGAIYTLVFQSDSRIQPKGTLSHDWVSILILYICMLLGMACSYFYDLFSKTGPGRPRFTARRFLAPLFVSPIVFIPLFGAFQNSEIDLAALTLPKYMVFFVAFENGFLWKQAFDNRSTEKKI